MDRTSPCARLSPPLSLFCPAAVAERLSQAEEAERLHPTCPQRYCAGPAPAPAPVLARWLLWRGDTGAGVVAVPSHRCLHTVWSLPGTDHLPAADHLFVLSTESCCSGEFICWGKKKKFYALISLV